jgi:glutathione synthase/RimK-type ligase-like ATP-grasp enzyme
MKLCFILEARDPPHINEVIVGTVALLESCGNKVTMVYPEKELWRMDGLQVDADLYLLKSDSELALSLAHSLEQIGARVINTYDTCRRLKDKTHTAGQLVHAGILTPQSFAASDATFFAPLLNQGPLILKPNHGYHGVGISIVNNTAELNSATNYSDIIFAQSYLAEARNDIKLFGIGNEIFALRKPFSKESYKQKGIPIHLTPEYERIARRCADTFGLDLYGIDVAECDGETYVIDVNYFPGYRGIGNVQQILTDFILRALKDMQ